MGDKNFMPEYPAPFIEVSKAYARMMEAAYIEEKKRMERKAKRKRAKASRKKNR